MSDDDGPVLNITPGMRRHLNVVKGQRMYQDEGRWFVWRRLAQPPYTDGADRFRWWKPRHLAAAVAQWRWARRYWGSGMSLALGVLAVAGVFYTLCAFLYRSMQREDSDG